jgi:hypothetical protein
MADIIHLKRRQPMDFQPWFIAAYTEFILVYLIQADEGYDWAAAWERGLSPEKAARDAAEGPAE